METSSYAVSRPPFAGKSFEPSLLPQPRSCNEPVMRFAVISMVLMGLVSTACDDEVRPASWSYIHEAIIVPNCTASACHSRISAAFGIALHDREGAYSYLTGTVCGQQDPAQPPRNLVVPFDPARSKLMYLLRGQEVRSMPPDIPLPDAEIEIIEEWILEGAPCD